MTRQTIPLLLIAAALSSGCRYGEILAFGGGGKPLATDTDGGSSTGDDTGTPTNDTGEPSWGTAPSILNLQTSLEEYPDISWVVELTVTYTDPDDDVDGGKVELTALLDGQDPMEITVPIDGSQAIHDPDDGTVFVALRVNDGDVSGSLSVVLVDSAGLKSEPYDQPL
jgi:hypothetical protein